MIDYDVNLTVEDTICDNCCENTIQKTVLITSASQTVALQDCYVLNVVASFPTYFTVLIQNGTQVIVRNIFTNFSTSLCLPSKCKKHLLTISGTIVQT